MEIDTHEKVFQLYNELKKQLPINFMSNLKVIRSKKFPPASKNIPIIQRIENEKSQKNKQKPKPTKIIQNINIFNGPAMSQNLYKNNYKITNKGKRNIKELVNPSSSFKSIFNNNRSALSPRNSDDELNSKTIINSSGRDQSFNDDYFTQKQVTNNNLITDRNKTILNKQKNEVDKNTLNNFYDADERPSNYYWSSPVGDMEMKNNVYLPRIIDRMKYSIPRNMRETHGFLLEGYGVETVNFLIQNNLNTYNISSNNSNVVVNNDGTMNVTGSLSTDKLKIAREKSIEGNTRNKGLHLANYKINKKNTKKNDDKNTLNSIVKETNSTFKKTGKIYSKENTMFPKIKTEKKGK